MGHRLSRPALANDTVFAIMAACWSPDRPTFSDMAKTLDGIIAQESGPRTAAAAEPLTPVPHLSNYKVLRVDHHDEAPQVQRHNAPVVLPFLMAEGMPREPAEIDDADLQHLETSV
jgi:hypothetical protein